MTNTTRNQQSGQANREAGQIMDTLKKLGAAALMLLGFGFNIEAVADVEAPPTVSLTSPTANSTYIFPASITMQANAYAGNSDAHIDKVEFFVNGVEVGEDLSAPYQFNYTPPATGTYTLHARAKSDHDQSTTSASITVTLVANQAPSVTLVSPASGSSAIAPAAFTLTANASDADGTITKVEFYNGTILLGSATSAPYSFSWSNVAVGSYSLTAKATDDRGAQTTTSAATVTVNANQAPTVSLTSPAANSVLTAPTNLILAASAADSDGTITQVDFYADGSLLGSSTTAPYNFSWNNISIGSHSLTAIATDNLGAATTSTATAINVIAPPIVSLTAPANNTVATAPASITLTANASSAGSIAQVDFYNGTILIGTATAAPYSFNWTNVAAGSYSISAAATDGNGATTTSAPITLVANAAPTVSLTSPAANSVLTAPASFTLTANAADADGTIAKVEFYNGTTLIGTATAAPYSFNWTNVAAGSYSITAIATDNYGATTTSTLVAVISNQLPGVSLTSPIANTVSVAPGSFTLTANAADSDGSITKVDFYADGILIGTAAAAPYTFAWTNVPAGSHSLSAIATDNLNGSTTSATVVVISNAIPMVSLTAPTTSSSYTTPANITVSANPTDTDGSIAKVEFYANDGTTNTLIGTSTTGTAGSYSINWNAAPAGNYSLTAIATDNLGAATTSTATAINVISPPTVSLTAPANNTVATAPASFTLTANASSAGSIAQVDFYNGTTLIGTATAAPYSYAWTNVPSGSYTITAVATDGNGATTTSAPITLIANAAPTISLTSPAANAVSIAPGSFSLSANATDTDGSITKVEFYANDGTTNTLVGTVTQAPYTFNWSNVAAGSYSITAIASDNYGATTTSAAVSVTADAIPTVSLTSPAPNSVSVAPGSFTLTANASSTTSSIIKVDFYAADAATNTSTLIGTATTGTAGVYSLNWTNVAAGSYSLTAVATSAWGTTTTSAAISVISDQAPSVTLTGPTNGTQITSPNSYTLTAEASSVTSTIAKVEFYANDGTTNLLLGTATAAPYSVTWNNVPVGNFTLSAIATDALGIATTSATVTVNAIANVPPAVSLTSPTNGATATVPGSFTLTADAVSTTSTVAKVDFYAIDNASNASTLIGTATQVPYSTTWSNVPVGSYTLSAVATDTLNAITTSAAVGVTVKTGVAQVYYIHTDHLDTPREITDVNGNTVWLWDNSDPFGNNAANENPNGAGQFSFPLRFPGQYADKETNTNYNVNRDYDRAIGRYIESDPIGLLGGVNTYGYVGDNPLSYIDPLGLLDRLLFDGKKLIGYDNFTVEWSVPATSGPWGLGTLPSGAYKGSYLRTPRKENGMKCSDSSGWSLNLDPMFETDRTLLRIHPDGGTAGTQGCIGVNCSNQAKVYDALKDYFSQSGNKSIPLIVTTIPIH